MISKIVAITLISFCFVPIAHGKEGSKQEIVSGTWHFAVTPDEFGDPPAISLASIAPKGMVAILCHDNIFEFRFMNGEDYVSSTAPLLGVKFKMGTKITETLMTSTTNSLNKLIIAGSIGEIKADPASPNDTPYIASQEVLQGIESTDGAFSLKIGDYTAKFGRGAKSLFPKFRTACEATAN